MATLEDLEARVAALEHAFGLTNVKTRMDGLEQGFTDFRQETRANFRTVDEQLAEIKDLIVGRHNGN